MIWHSEKLGSDQLGIKDKREKSRTFVKMAATTTLSLRNFLEKQKQKQQQKINHVLLETPEQQHVFFVDFEQVLNGRNNGRGGQSAYYPQRNVFHRVLD